MQRLEDRGIVSAMPSGRSHAVRPGMKGCALRKIPAPAARAEESPYEAMPGALRRGLARKPCSIASAALFGGTVRGEGHGRGGTDLPVASGRREDAVEATIRPAAGICHMFGLPVEPMIYTAGQFAERRGKYFPTSALAEYAMAHGKGPREL